MNKTAPAKAMNWFSVNQRYAKAGWEFYGAKQVYRFNAKLDPPTPSEEAMLADPISVMHKNAKKRAYRT